MWPDSLGKGPWRFHGHWRNQRSVDIPTAPASSRASRASGLDTPGRCGSPFSECLGKDLHWEGQSMYCQGCKPCLCVPLPLLTTRIPFAHYLTAPPPCNQAGAHVCGDSFLCTSFPSSHFFGAGEGGALAKHTSPTIFFQNLIMMGTDPGPGLPRCSPCEYLHGALLWEPGITRAWHLSPACLVTLGRSKLHCKKSCSLCLLEAMSQAGPSLGQTWGEGSDRQHRTPTPAKE